MKVYGGNCGTLCWLILWGEVCGILGGVKMLIRFSVLHFTAVFRPYRA